MNFFHLSIGHVSRSTGRSTVQNVAYITGEALHEERRNKPANYANNRGKTTWETMAPMGSGIEKNDLSIWNKLENFEDAYARQRFHSPATLEKYLSCARTAQTYETSLPKELTQDQNVELVREIIRERFVSKGLVATYAINWNEGNPHVHITVSTRTVWNGEISWDKSVARHLSSRSEFRESRKIFAEFINKHQELAGVLDRVDHRSYADRGLELIPTHHKGWHAHQLEKEGLCSRISAENAQILEENKERIAQVPGIILKELTSKQATFSERDVVRLVFERMKEEGGILSQHVIYSVLKEAVEVGIGFDDLKRYTSPDYKAKEDHILDSLERYGNQPAALPIDQDAVEKMLNGEASWLTDGQKEAIRTLGGDARLGILIGRAGTGKTTALRSVVQLHQLAGYTVKGMAPSATAAHELRKGAGCESDTLAHYAYYWKKYHNAAENLQEATTREEKHFYKAQVEEYAKYLPDEKTLLLLDEAGMVGVGGALEDRAGGWDALIKTINLTGSKLIVVGDDHQFKPVEAGDIFRKVIDSFKGTPNLGELSDIQRQTIPWMKEASGHLAELRAGTALEMYDQQGHVQVHETNEHVYQDMARQYLRCITREPDASPLVLAYTNAECQALNRAIRTLLKENGLLTKEDLLKEGYTVGDKIVFTQNDRGFLTKFDSSDPTFFVRNGCSGIIEAIQRCRVKGRGEDEQTFETYQIVVRVEEEDTRKKGTLVSFYLNEYSQFQHGYAVTTHKSQGATANGSLVKLSRYMDAYALYVALTRHRHDITLYYSQEDFANFQDLLKTVGKVSVKDLAADYSILEENQAFWVNVQDYKALGYELLSVKTFAKTSDPANKAEQEKIWSTVDQIQQERKGLAKIILEGWEVHGDFVRQAGLTREAVEIAAGLKKRPLSRLETQAQLVVEQYASVAIEARQVWRSIRRTHPGSRAKTHPEWETFQALRDQRDTLAHQIMQSPVLYRPFLKEAHKAFEEEGNAQKFGYGLSILKAQSQAHQSKMLRHVCLQQEMLKTTPDPELSEKLKTLLDYGEARDFSASLWKDLKPKLKQVERTLLSEAFCKEIADFTESRMGRDQLALKIIDAWEDYDPLIQKVGMKLPFEKLIDQKEQAVRDNLLKIYTTTPEEPQKLQAAFELKNLMEEEATGGKKITVAQVYGHGLNPKDITHQARQYEKLKLLETLPSRPERQQLLLLTDYEDKCYMANQLYRKCLGEGKTHNKNTGKDLKPWDSPFWPDYQAVVCQRNAVAFDLSQDSGFLEHLTLAEQKGWVIHRKALISHAEEGYRQKTITQYKELGKDTTTESEMAKAKLAGHLTQMIRDDQAEGHKKTLVALYQANLNPKDVFAEARDFKDYTVLRDLETEEDRHLFERIYEYKVKSAKANEIYRQCVHDRDQSNIKITENPLYESYLAAVANRNERAAALLSCDDWDKCLAIAEHLEVTLDEDKMIAQFEDHRLRILPSHLSQASSGHTTSLDKDIPLPQEVADSLNPEDQRTSPPTMDPFLEKRTQFEKSRFALNQEWCAKFHFYEIHKRFPHPDELAHTWWQAERLTAIEGRLYQRNLEQGFSPNPADLCQEARQAFLKNTDLTSEAKALIKAAGLEENQMAQATQHLLFYKDKTGENPTRARIQEIIEVVKTHAEAKGQEQGVSEASRFSKTYSDLMEQREILIRRYKSVDANVQSNNFLANMEDKLVSLNQQINRNLEFMRDHYQREIDRGHGM